MNEFTSSLSKESLIKLNGNYSKNWLAMDGLWFQAVEKRYGMDAAIVCDLEVWRYFSKIEATRIKQFLCLEDEPGIDGLEKALKLRMYSNINRDEIIINGNILIYRTLDCRVQNARARKNMPLHPCKSVGIVEYSVFAQTIDPRFQCDVISCYPDIVDYSCHCAWKFTLP